MTVMLYLFTEISAHALITNKMATEKHHGALGIGIYFFTYSTWEGPVLYVEDLFVTPTARGKLRAADIPR